MSLIILCTCYSNEFVTCSSMHGCYGNQLLAIVVRSSITVMTTTDLFSYSNAIVTVALLLQ